jgi:hypothetical protein
MNKAQTKRMSFIKFDGGETTKGKGFKKKTWYSICSRHGVHDNNCDMCNTGSWQNDCKGAVSGWFYKHFTKLWVWWVNNI